MTTVICQDLRALKYCMRGSRQFFERHGLPWHDFLQRGIEADALLCTGDAMAARAVEQAQRREAGE
jgi:DNA-binding LacI/PurR family transcriptional regulator